MKKVSLVILIAMIVCTVNACAHLSKEGRASTKETTSLLESQSVSHSKNKRNSLSQWLFREPAHYSESYERGVYRVRDRK